MLPEWLMERFFIAGWDFFKKLLQLLFVLDAKVNQRSVCPSDILFDKQLRKRMARLNCLLSF
jgi:hypothetical protein